MSNVELRNSFYFIFLKRAERQAAQAPALHERHPQFVPRRINYHSPFHEVSYERRLWPEKRPV
jgi:hypothetical protein